LAMLHIKLMELEAELLAREQAQKAGMVNTAPECEIIKEAVEQEIGLKLGDFAAGDWRGWLTYRRSSGDLVIIRGRAFKDGLFTKWRAGFDLVNGKDAASEYLRKFDVSAPADLDHLMLNFGVSGGDTRVFLWYGENLAPYRLIFEADLADINNSESLLHDAIAEGLSWIVGKPKELTLPEYFKKLKAN
jgi:hypothetical protein